MDFHCLSAGKTFLVTFLWEQFEYVFKFRGRTAVFSYEMRGQELSLYWSRWLDLDQQRPRLWSIDIFKLWHIIGMYWGLPGGTMVKNPLASAGDARDSGFGPWVGKIPWGRKWQPIPWTEGPGGLQSMGFQRVGHEWVTEHARIGMYGKKYHLFPGFKVLVSIEGSMAEKNSRSYRFFTKYCSDLNLKNRSFKTWCHSCF